MFGLLAHIKACIFALLVFLIDFLTKFLTQKYIPVFNQHLLHYPYGGVGVFKNFFGVEFSIVHVCNWGAAWGILHNFQVYLLIVRLILIAAVFIYLIKFNRQKSWEIPLSLIIAGAFGNVLDYFFYGHVVDMFHFIFWGYEYPVFNIADSAICIGIFWLFFLSWIERKAVVT